MKELTIIKTVSSIIIECHNKKDVAIMSVITNHLSLENASNEKENNNSIIPVNPCIVIEKIILLVNPILL